MNEHDQMESLIGAYALDAIDALERRRLERHLATCEDCANEVRMLRETAAELAWLPDPADASEVVENIARKMPSRTRRRTSRISVAVAAVAVVVAGVFGGLFVGERRENARFENLLASADLRANLTPQGGFEGRGVLHIGEGEAALILEDLPPPGRDRAYQLWAVKGGKPRSLAVVEATGRVVRLLDYTGAGETFALTIEPAGGSPVPTSDPVLASV